MRATICFLAFLSYAQAVYPDAFMSQVCEPMVEEPGAVCGQESNKCWYVLGTHCFGYWPLDSPKKDEFVGTFDLVLRASQTVKGQTVKDLPDLKLMIFDDDVSWDSILEGDSKLKDSLSHDEYDVTWNQDGEFQMNSVHVGNFLHRRQWHVALASYSMNSTEAGTKGTGNLLCNKFGDVKFDLRINSNGIYDQGTGPKNCGQAVNLHTANLIGVLVAFIVIGIGFALSLFYIAFKVKKNKEVTMA